VIKQLTGRLESLGARLEAVEKQLSSPSSVTTTRSSGGASRSVGDFEASFRLIDEYVTLSGKINPVVKQQADLVKQAVQAHRDFLNAAAQSKKPSDTVLQSLIKPTSDLIVSIVELRDDNRTHACWNHLSTVGEGVSCFGWVGAAPTPGPFVDDSRSSSEFWSNKILVQYRKDESATGKMHTDWVKAWNSWMHEFRDYIKQYHTTGITWGGSADASSFAGKSSSSASSSSGGPPPPPPGPPPDVSTSAPPPSGGGHAALFADINKVKERQGSGKTEGLRKVTDDMKTYKNPALKAAAVVPASSQQKTSGAPAKKGEAQSKPAKFALEGNKWVIEYQSNNKMLAVEDPEPKQTVYIYKCDSSVVQIKGKVNNITLDSCNKTGVVFDNAIASIEVVNCRGCQIQVTGKVPSVAIDKTSGCQVFLSEEALNVEIVTSKSDEINVVVPGATPADDSTELAVPEQFKTVVQNRKLVTECVAHLG